MVRRRLTVKRLDPWSVLKFGFVANIVLLVMFLLVALVVWLIIDRLAIVDQLCEIALDVGFTQCGVDFGNLFRALVLLGLLWVVVQTAVLVFFSFLHNLLADLTGGLTVTVNDTTPGAAARGEQVTTAHQPRPLGSSTGPGAGGGSRVTGRPPVPPLRPDPHADDPTRPGDPGTSQPQATERHEQPKPDPHAPADTGGADSSEVMFGDRPDRGSR